MYIYIEIEDLVANAFIELVEKKKKEKFSSVNWTNMAQE